MKSKNEKYILEENGITCPSCLQIKYSRSKISKFIEQLEALNNNPLYFEGNRSVYFENAKDYKSEKDYLEIKWACNECFG